MRPEKEKAITEIREKLSKSKGAYFVDFKGMNTEMVNELRNKFRSFDVEYKVIKNTLAQIALKDLPYNIEEKYFKLSTGIAFSYDNPFTPAKVLDDFIKKYEKPKVKCSVIEEKVYNEVETVRFFKLPSKEELLGRILAGFNSPIAGFVGVLGGVSRKLLYVLNSMKEKKENS